ncbi:MAG: calcium-binding protein, partial [Candidatus Pacebacteria bacterium]|nr:calcium-binding protein [Candidatus Paceibacterota bacterium]
MTSAADSGAGSLRAAIAAATPGTTITFNTALSGQTILLTSGQIPINSSVDIDASALSGGITIDGNANGRIFS